ncbi:MAG: rhomboid family intramembrane serine protease [Microscillaceae bacterium]|nr:rhomboid family intramembrane serine protease [Microscillaceae bacterium]MDW8459836.1 rhomboid family intramembrane serine protease [Cytophagales bacterium]
MLRIRYNSPVILTYTFICVLVMFIASIDVTATNTRTLSGIKQLFAICSSASFSNPFTYFTLFSHIAGHADWQHLINNFLFILVVGPMMEEKYGSRRLLSMILATALLTGILQVIFFNSCLLGASGIVFMLILLSSFANAQAQTIPLTFILIALLYLGQEVFNAIYKSDNISQFAHIIGGICGGVFGYMFNSKNS